MRGDKDMRQMALQVSIALVAGMFSVVPVVQGAPVGGTSATATITYSDVVENNQVVGQNTNITSNVTNNVIDWQDFSVAAKEKVDFDTNNYMNIVTGNNTSTINGAINGGGDIYIINPSGVVIGKGAEINTGSFYASTRDISVTDAVGKATMANDTNSTEALSDLIKAGSSTTGAAMDIVNMGNIKATDVVLEGANIRLLNSADIQATNVTVRADDGYIHVGSVDGNGGSYTSEKLTATGSAKDVEKYTLVDNTNWSTTLGTGNNVTGNYMLAEDIDLKDGAKNTVTGIFTGKIDGNFYVVKNAVGTSTLVLNNNTNKKDVTGAAGLFTYTKDAVIENIGIKDSKFSSTPDSDDELPVIGGLVGTAVNTELYNVFNDNTKVMGDDYSGGIVGTANGLTMDSSYNTGSVLDYTGSSIVGSGLIGVINGGTNEITNCYSTAKTTNGVLYTASSGETNYYNVYAEGTKFHGNLSGTASGTKVNIYNSIDVVSTSQYRTTNSSGTEVTNSGSVDLKKLSSFTSGALSWDNADISDTGGLARKSDGSLDTDSNGKIFRPAWRIYEGQSAPILTAFTKGIKTTTYDYAYYDNSGTKDTDALSYNNYNNGGKDMTAYTYTADSTSATGYKNDGLVYNGETLKIVDADGTALTSADTTALFQKADASSIDASHISYDTAGQRDATYSTTTGQGKKALIYSDQNGYDLVGNNIAIAPRQVTITNDLSNKKIIKEYDGSADARDHVSDLFSGNSTTSTGILEADSTSVMVKLSNTATAEFYDQGGNAASGDAGANKVVKINGTVYISDGTKDNNGNWAAYSGPNYVVVDKNGDPASSVTINSTVDAAIYQRRLDVDLKNVNLNKEYDKEQYVVDGSGNQKSFTTSDFTFDTAGERVNTGDVSLAVGSGNGAAAYYWDKTSGQKTADVGTHDVKIEGISLTGSGVKNYVLVNGDKIIYSFADVVKSDGTIDTSVTPNVAGIFTQDGTISPRQIANTGFQYYYTPAGSSTATTPMDANKEYDYTSAFNAPTDAQKDSNGKALWYVTNAAGVNGLLAGDSLKFQVNSAEFTTAADSSGTATVNAGSAQGAHYSVTISGESAKNYTFNGTDALADGGTADVYGTGTIDARTIYLVNGSNAVKDYDGNAYVSNDNTPFDLSKGYLTYDTNKGAAHQLLIDDTGVNDGATIAITGEYQSTNGEGAANVNYDTATDNVLAKNIIYTATVMQNGSASSNYILKNGNTGTTNTNTYNGTGKIEQKELGALTFAEVSKTYDGTADVTNSSNTTAPLYTDDEITINTPTEIIDGESITDVFYVDSNGKLDSTGAAKIMGLYGDAVVDSNGKVTAFTANANAAQNTQQGAHAAGTVTKVQYTGVKDLMKNHNYKLADGDGNVMYGDGTINRYLIDDKNAIALDRNTVAITKEYDSTNTIASPNAYLSSTDATVTLENGNVITGTDGLSVNVTGAEYSSAHSNDNTAQDVYYYVTANATGNYDVADSLKETSGSHQGEIQLALTNGGLITQKHITANDTMLKNSNLTKAYDATEAVDKTGDQLIDISNQILPADTGTVTNGITAKYVTDSTGAVGDVDASLTTQDKYVKYTLALNEDDDHKDYFIDDGTGSITVSYVNGITSAVKNTGATNFVVANNGTIDKRVLTVTFDDVHKIYDGSDKVTNSGTDTIRYTLANDIEADKVALTIGGPDGVKGTYGSYDSTTGAFTADENAGEKTVKYENLNTALTSTDAAKAANISRNYEFAANGIVYNTDTANNHIDKATIKLSDLKITADNISQEYNGTANVDNANSYITGSYIDFGGSTVDFTYDTTNVTADFVTAGSGTTIKGVGTGKDVTFSLSGITIPDAVLANFEWDSSDAPTVPNGSIAINRTIAGIGEVTPREIYATINNPTVSKTYNASNDVLDSAGNLISADGLVSFSRLDDTAAFVGGTSNTSSAVYTDNNKGTDKFVEYTISVSDGTNYNIYYNQGDVNGANYTTTDTNGNSVAAVGYTGIVEKVTTPNNVIEARDLTLSFDPVTKDYDGTINVPSVKIKPNFVGFANTTDKTNIVLKNGYTAAFASPNVKGTDGNGTNYITYGNLELDGNGSNNYNLLFKNADGTAGTAAETIGEGTINKYVLTQAPDIARNTTAVTKEYDGNAKVAYQDNTDLSAVKGGYLKSATVSINGSDQQLPFELMGAVYDNNDGSVTGTTGRGVTFSVKLNSDNIDFSNVLGGSSSGEFTFTDTGTITPRKLYVAVNPDVSISKVYDGNTDVLDEVAGILSITNTDKIVSGESVELANTAAALNARYNGKNVDTDIVTYDVQLLPSTTAGNYELHDANNPDGAAITTITGAGKITPRSVTISLKNPITLADKAYNGSDAADATAIVGNYALEVQNGGDTGILTDEVDEIDLDTDVVTATYANGGHVLRDSTGAPVADMVNFGNFNLTSNNAENPASNYTLTPAVLQGKGKITPLTIAVDLDHSPEKVYDGYTDVDNIDDIHNGNPVNKALDVDYGNVIAADANNISVSVTSGNFTPDAHVNTTADSKAYAYVVELKDTQGNADYELQLKNGSVRSFVTADYGQTATISGTDGNITPKTITFTAEDGINKPYDGTQVYDSAAAAAKVTFTGLADTDSKNTLNATITAVTTDDANAANDEADNTPKSHNVQYTVTINNADYQLGNTTDTALGTISRKGLNIVATPVSVNVGDSVPASFSGSVQGLVKNNNIDDTGLADNFTFGPDGTLSTTTAGRYGIYGWYMGNKSGNLGLNYTYTQDVGNPTAFTVNFVNNTDNPDTKITPTPDVYHKISKDMNSGFGDNDIAAIEYRNKKGTVIGTVTIDSGEVHSGGVESGTSSTGLGTDNTNPGKIGIAGGDIVNMEGADAASNASIAVSGDGTTVNLEVQSITDEMWNILDENSEAKIEKSEKEGKISIKSSDGQENDEIELTIEKEGVNVA